MFTEPSSPAVGVGLAILVSILAASSASAERLPAASLT